MCRSSLLLILTSVVISISFSTGGQTDNATVFVSGEMSSWNRCGTADAALDKALEEFALFLIPPENERIFGMEKVQEINRHLRENRRDIDRIILGGSMGKNTADHFPGISPPLEFDIFVYLNGRFDSGRPHSWTKTVGEFQKIIETWTKPGVEIVKVTSFYLSVFMDGIKIDISPVANLKVKSRSNSFQKLISSSVNNFDAFNGNPYENIQFAETLEQISSLANPIQQRRSFMRGFTEAHVTVFNHKIPPLSSARSLIRLGKFWSKENVLKHLDGKYFNPVGFSSFFERVALHAATYNFSTSTGTGQKSLQKSESLATAFSRFLKLLINFHSLNITHQKFDKDLNRFKRLRIFDFDLRWNRSCHAPGPFVSDLVDPFSNYAMLERDPWKRKQIIEILIATARKSLKDFEQLIEKFNQRDSKLHQCEDAKLDVHNFFVKFRNPQTRISS